MYGMQSFPVQNIPPQRMPAPQPQPQPQPQMAQQPQPAVWQATQPMPTKMRGVSAEPAAAKFVLPSPEALGVATKVQLPPAPAVDWTQIQARMARLGVVRYRKDPSPKGGIRATLVLPTADPLRELPIAAEGETEAAAIMIALQQAETTVRPR